MSNELQFVYELELSDRLLLRERMNKFSDAIVDDELYENALNSKIADITDLLIEIGLEYDKDNQSLKIYNELINNLEMLISYDGKEFNLTDRDDRKLLINLDKEKWNDIKIIESELFYFDENTEIEEVFQVYSFLPSLHESQQMMFVELYQYWVGTPLDLVEIMLSSEFY